MSEERKKLTVYLHPDQVADNVSLDIIDSVPRNDRGDLYRKALISGLALHHLDPRLPGLLALLLDKSFTADSLVGLLSQTTGWKPSQANIRDVLAELGAGTFYSATKPEIVEDDEKRRLEEARIKLKGLF
ncbi:MULTISPECIES: plasmid partitioning/stability family protein [Enterobacteriaceae]|uniref:Plasmid stability protein n=2 Tax=Enterobacteriaceae TaxID=543 RepID=A0AA44Z656_CROSK|nr:MULTISPECIES: plasmid partitioning/stability family protein [Enterobacteriaceae]EBZ0660745.1 plasmid stability protein [Salmonella enterica subsp. enterica serovar Haifa]HBR5336414.1 plasmid stability protein [Klebsiella pneumoniae]HCR1970816.1 plasmid stability protein [Enterobacter hormaechei subsp. xiangfangensis]HDT3487565.1 plasmid stability protein [Enterobacter hormaechei subsp. hoffmannii]HED2959761.1 plasmid stability protein [Enterobacter hormaechei subsp. steigerwaltii]